MPSNRYGYVGPDRSMGREVGQLSDGQLNVNLYPEGGLRRVDGIYDSTHVYKTLGKIRGWYMYNPTSPYNMFTDRFNWA